MTRRRRAAWATVAIPLLAGCAITRSVQPVSHPLADATLCVEQNGGVADEHFLQALCEEFERHDVRTWVYQGVRPRDCRYHATYTARWHGGLVPYLRSADIEVFDDDTTIGRAVYDASGATANPCRFGSGIGKLRPLVDELMREASAPAGR